MMAITLCLKKLLKNIKFAFIRDVQGVDDNPFDFVVKKKIEERLNPEFEGRFKIMLVPM